MWRQQQQQQQHEQGTSFMFLDLEEFIWHDEAWSSAWLWYLHYNQFPTGNSPYFYDFLCLIFFWRCENSCHKCLSVSLTPSPSLCNVVVLLLLSFVRLEYAASPSGILCIILIFVKLSTRPVFMRHSHRWLHTPPKSNGPKTRCGHDKVFRQGLIRLQIYELLRETNSWAAVEKNFLEVKGSEG